MPLFDIPNLNLQELADPLFPDETLPKKDGEKFVVFFLTDALFAVQAAAIAEVTRPLSFTPLPDSPSWLAGVANLRGEIITVVSLARIFRKKPTPTAPRTKFIVLKPLPGYSPVAFAVDRLAEVVTLAPGEIAPADDHRLLGIADHVGADVGILDTDRIYATLL